MLLEKCFLNSPSHGCMPGARSCLGSIEHREISKVGFQKPPQHPLSWLGYSPDLVNFSSKVAAGWPQAGLTSGNHCPKL